VSGSHRSQFEPRLTAREARAISESSRTPAERVRGQYPDHNIPRENS
jgi:hypothetical protein